MCFSCNAFWAFAALSGLKYVKKAQPEKRTSRVKVHRVDRLIVIFRQVAKGSEDVIRWREEMGNAGTAANEK